MTTEQILILATMVLSALGACLIPGGIHCVTKGKTRRIYVAGIVMLVVASLCALAATNVCFVLGERFGN